VNLKHGRIAKNTGGNENIWQGDRKVAENIL